jgi:tripartite-type tricarboxylate transporter receptor subunit TctC
MPNLPRRTVIVGAATFALACPALAQPRPPVTMVVPYAAGGGTDIVGREFGPLFSEALGQTVVIDNRGGAAGHVGSMSVARARPDATTLLFAVSTNIIVNPHLQRGDRFDLAAALAPIAQVSTYQYVLAIDPRLPITTLAELSAYARSRPPSDLSFSSAGVGSNNHLAGLLFSERVGFEMEHISYRGTGPALLDVVAGRVTMNFSSPPPAIPLIQDGKLRALAVTGATRMASLPDVPTLAEAGMPGITITGWHGVFAPAQTPAAELDRMHEAARRAAARPEFAGKLERDGLEASPPRTRAEFTNLVREENRFWAAKVRELNIRLD